MRRTLVNAHQTTRHPFLASLPPRLRTEAQAEAERDARRITAQDVKDFLMAYCACFIAAMAFIA